MQNDEEWKWEWECFCNALWDAGYSILSAYREPEAERGLGPHANWILHNCQSETEVKQEERRVNVNQRLSKRSTFWNRLQQQERHGHGWYRMQNCWFIAEALASHFLPNRLFQCDCILLRFATIVSQSDDPMTEVGICCKLFLLMWAFQNSWESCLKVDSSLWKLGHKGESSRLYQVEAGKSHSKLEFLEFRVEHWQHFQTFKTAWNNGTMEHACDFAACVL